MKPSIKLTLAALIMLALSSASTHAVIRIKANNTDDLNLASSWAAGTVPGTADIAVWDGTVTAANTVALGANITTAVRILSPAGLVTITPTASATLSLRAAGIDLTTATQDLTINCLLGQSQANTWNIASGRTFTAGGVLSGTVAFTKDGEGTAILNQTAANTFSAVPIIRSGTLTVNSGVGATLGNAVGANLTGTALLNFDNAGAAGAIAQSQGALSFSSGEGELRLTRSAAQDLGLTFSSLSARGVGAAGVITYAGGTVGTQTKVVVTGLSSGYAKGLFVGTSAGSAPSFAFYDSSGYFRSAVYDTGSGGDAGFVTSAGGTIIGSLADTHVDLTGNVTAQTDASYASIRLPGATTLAIATGQTLALSSGAILKQAGGIVSTITGGTVTNNGTELVIRTDTSSDLLTVDSTLTGTGALTKSGAGTLTLGAVNSYTGNTYIDNGVLTLGNQYALGGSTIVAAGGMSCGTLTATTPFTGVNALTNQLSYTSPGAIRVGGANNLEFTNSVNLGTWSTSPPGYRNVRVDDVTLTLSGPIIGAGASGSGSFNKIGNGTLLLTGGTANTWARWAFNVNSGTVVFRKDNGVPASAVDVVVGDDLGGAGADVVRWEADEQIRDDHDLTVNGSGLANLNGHTETLNKIYAGSDAGAIGAPGGQLSLGVGGMLICSNSATAGSPINNKGVSVTGSGTVKFRDSGTIGFEWGAANSYVGPTIIDSGKFRITASGVLPNTTDLTVNLGGPPLAYGIFDLNSFNQTVDGLIGNGVVTNRAATASTLTVGGNNEATATFSGAIKSPSGAINLIKTGTGTQILNGANTYTGTTMVNGGTLLVNAPGTSGTGAVSVNSGTLGGDGTIQGAVTVASGGTIGAGSSAGTLTLTNGLDMSTGGTNAWELAANSTATPGADFDQISLTGGNLALGGSSAFVIKFIGTATAPDVSVAFWQVSHTWKIVALSGIAANPGSTTFASIVNGTFAAGSFTTSVDGSGNVLLTFAPPAVALDAPVNGATFVPPANISLSASVTPNGGTIDKVEFYEGANKIGEDTTAPYTLDWNGIVVGNYALKARVLFNTSGSLDSAVNNITVAVPPPVVVLDTPTNNATFTAPANISLGATVTANGNTIDKVEFYEGANKLGEDAVAPYTLDWNSVGIGAYALKARVVYNTSSTLESAANSVTVSSALVPVTSMTIGLDNLGNCMIGYSGGTGTEFVLLSSTNVTAAMNTWGPVHTNTSTPGTFTNALGLDPAMFYRIESK